MNNKLIVVFNTCGISGREDIHSYIKSIHSILNQNFQNYRIVVSSCLNSSLARNILVNEFGDKVSYNFINDKLPVNITFNHSVQKMVENYNEADGYLYIDSGIDFENNKSVLKDLYELHKSGPYGMTASRTNTDAGTFLWFKKGSGQSDESGQEDLFENGNFIIPVGKTTNLHVQIFDNKIFKEFEKRILPDIFASHCTESTFSFINAALCKKFIIAKHHILSHNTSMDGASSGFRPEYINKPPWKHLLDYAHKTIEEIILDPEAHASGFGYEECQNILMHNPDCYEENGFAKNPERLKKFIINNIYLKKCNFDYENINHIFIK